MPYIDVGKILAIASKAYSPFHLTPELCLLQLLGALSWSQGLVALGLLPIMLISHTLSLTVLCALLKKALVGRLPAGIYRYCFALTT